MHNPDIFNQSGILSAQHIEAALAAGYIYTDTPASPNKIEKGQIQPASLDLRLGPRAWRIQASFLPGRNQTVLDKINKFSMYPLDLTQDTVLETGCVYIVELRERLALPKTISAIANPKSSTGRLDIFTRLITDGASEFESVPKGYHGPLYAEISPRTFSIKLRQNSRLSQLRLRNGHIILDDKAHAALQKKYQLVQCDNRAPQEARQNNAPQEARQTNTPQEARQTNTPQTPPQEARQNNAPSINNGIALSVHLTPNAPPNDTSNNDPNENIIGWRARKHAGLIDIDKAAHYPASKFWEAVRPHDLIQNTLVLNPDEFYILASREFVSVPPAYAAEMRAYDTSVGEFRAHYAGFFDPGFGNGTNPTRAVLEVRSHDVPFLIEQGQTVCRLVYEPMAQIPKNLYGTPDSGSNYQAQGLKLAKHFITSPS